MGETAYIGRVVENSPMVAPPQVKAEPTLLDVAGLELARAGLLPQRPTAPGLSEGTIDRFAAQIGFTAARNAVREAGLPQPVPLRGGPGVGPPNILVSGATLDLATPSTGVRTFVHQDTDTKTASVVVDLGGKPGGTVALRFGDGSGTVIAALRDYIGTVVVVDGRVSNISYAPSFHIGREEQEHLDQLHSAVAAAARFGVFRISGDGDARKQQAAQLADRVAFSRVSIQRSVSTQPMRSQTLKSGASDVVREIMRGDLGIELFDVAMLAGALSGGSRDHGYPPAPFCPLLSQGWALLPAHGVVLAKEVAAARDHLRNALWTTFEPAGMEILVAALKSGRPL